MSRLRSLCNALYVRPKNRAKARFLQDVFHRRKKNILLKTHMGFLGQSPKQSAGRENRSYKVESVYCPPRFATGKPE